MLNIDDRPPHLSASEEIQDLKSPLECPWRSDYFLLERGNANGALVPDLPVYGLVFPFVE
jgi:hypothetical protein